LAAEKLADRVRVTGSFIVRPTTDEFGDQGIIAEYVVKVDFPADAFAERLGCARNKRKISIY
jgi:hypothetical protein